MNNIVHLDIDAFYISVEENENPSIAGKPAVVGGLSERGIVTTANYEARKYGIHSAMPIFMAKNLCEDLIIVPMHRQKYVNKSREVFDIIYEFSDIVEQVSIDECYIELDDLDPIEVVKALKKKIKVETGLNISVGLSYNKFLAKLASEWNKPNGFKIIDKSDVPDILLPLDIDKVHGLGKKSQKKLRNIGINTISDLMNLGEDFLFENFGKHGIEIYERIRGIDNRKVETTRIRKSISVERTFDDNDDLNELKILLTEYVDELDMDLKKHNVGFQTLSIKMKDREFNTTTHAKTYPYTIIDKDDLFSKSMSIFLENYNGRKLRLLGITCSNLVELDTVQMNFIE